jgi:superfamily II DNA or RNA helicase
MTRTERQIQALRKWKEQKCKGCIVAATGVGKTRMALIAISKVVEKNPTIKTVVVVPTKALKKQWLEKLEEWQLDAEVLIMNTAASKPFKCGFLVLDEAHRINSDVMSNTLQNCSPHFILGLTATFERLDGKEKQILEKYAPVCDTITVKEAVENGWLSPYRKYKVFLDVDLTEYNKATQTFLSAFSFFNFDFNLALAVVANKHGEQKKLAETYNCDIKEVKANAYSFNRALQFRKNFIANHPKKLEIAKKILEARKNKKCITFNGSIDMCKQYGFGYLLNSKQKDKENDKILEEFNKVTTGVIHTSKMANEGLDIPGLSVGVVAGFNSSPTAAIQTLGRCIRSEEGKIAEFFILVLRNTVENQWFKKAQENQEFIEINESELQTVLDNEPINKQVQVQEKVNVFRF